MVRGAWGSIVGRTVAGVVRGEAPSWEMVYLCFDDGTGFEIFGRDLEGASRIRFKSVRQAREEFEKGQRPFVVNTDIAPPLDPRTVKGPDYVGVPEPDAALIGWGDVEGAAPPVFDVWCGDAGVAWARAAWGILARAGLTSYRDGIGRAEVLLRFLALGEVYRDFCACAWDEPTKASLGELAATVVISPFRLGQHLGADFLPEADFDAAIFDGAVREAVRDLRPGVVRALRGHFGSDVELFLWMWISNDPDRACRAWEELDDDELDEVMNDPSERRLAAYTWITEGMRPLRG